MAESQADSRDSRQEPDVSAAHISHGRMPHHRRVASTRRRENRRGDRLIPKDFEGIVKEDVEALVTNAVSEGRTIEYKEQLPGGTDEDKKEFLADASSFANAGGGDLIFGIREQRDANGKATGIPEAAEGLVGAKVDGEKRRFEDMLRAGIDPRIPGLRIKHIDGFTAGPVIILRVPKSWASPHMVTFKNLSRF